MDHSLTSSGLISIRPDEKAPRFCVEQVGECYFVRDNVRQTQLPYGSRNLHLIESVVSRLVRDYEDYVRSIRR